MLKAGRRALSDSHVPRSFAEKFLSVLFFFQFKFTMGLLILHASIVIEFFRKKYPPKDEVPVPGKEAGLHV